MYGVICGACGWKGKQADLEKVSRYDGYDDAGDPIFVENYDGCPICKNEDDLVYEGEAKWTR